MTTPTKEQIELLKRNLEKDYNTLLSYYWIAVIVEEWEKIRNSTK